MSFAHTLLAAEEAAGAAGTAGFNLWTGVGIAAGLIVGALVRHLLARTESGKSQAQAQALLKEAEDRAAEIRRAGEVAGKEELLRAREEIEKEKQDMLVEVRQKEKRLEQKEENLERRADTVSKKETKAEEARRQFEEQTLGLETQKAEWTALVQQQRDTLLKLSGISPEDARQQVLSRIEDELAEDASNLIRKRLEAVTEESDAKAREILTTAIQRVTANHAAEVTVTVVDLPDDDIKGRIIGREGRNIRAFERETGVDVIIDDTPGVVVVSAFDLVRREVAARSMRKLIEDGRIHPGRIEEVVRQMQTDVEKDIVETGKQWLFDMNIHNVHPKLQYLAGRLKYRTSYGQNILLHSMEVAYICEHIAHELGLDGELARRAGFFHDIGKAVDHEHEGGHPKVGAEFLKRYREREEVCEAAAGHHLDFEPKYPYTIIAHIGDAISASRPGARRETMDNYIKRLERLEAVATQHAGVTTAFAVQAGREVRVIVDADQVDDANALTLARNIAQQIEDELTYPGEVRVTLLRERRIVEYAR